MNQMYNDSFYLGWGWILWLGFIVLLFSSFGNWGYSYRAHRKVDGATVKDALAMLNERYASGEVSRDSYLEMKADIGST
jgi:putative membrane protein